MHKDSVKSVDHAISSTSYMSSLNPAQLQAVTHNPATPLQILAGPGSGKTKVLTSRIAYLILTQSTPPSSICAVTFTNKAASEMRERLLKLIGEKRTLQVRMGTFHALCAMFLRKHGKLVGLETNFTICDAEESKKIITTLLKSHKDSLERKCIALKEGTVLSMISKAKAKRCVAAEFSEELVRMTASKSNSPTDIDYVVAEIYTDYERSLRQNNSLDFDDLLLYGVQLFTRFDHTTAWCNHILVDEFQDTNYIQYDLMTALAMKKCVTIVGDPDQSIYGWRSAEVENLAKMLKDFPGTTRILLEQNYRSTAPILKASLAIIAQDKLRIQKSLCTSHSTGLTPVLLSFLTEHEEANFIASEIKQLVAQMGGILKWGDFAVLLRFSALSRTIESALQKEGIPSKILGGHKFFERLEIKHLLAYLQLIDNPNFDPALIRAVNVPSRGVGEKTLTEIAERTSKSKQSQLSIIEAICDGRLPDIKPPVKQKLSSFAETIRTLRTMANEGSPPTDLIRRLLDLVEFEAYLKKTQPDWESRWENVQELLTFASEVERNIGTTRSLSLGEGSSTTETPLRVFLEASVLSSEGDTQHDEEAKERVTISTCHAAKGLEWPVVMIPAVEQGSFPFYRSEDTKEERRLLYVACTRARGLLYVSFAEKRKVAGDTKAKGMSEFISAVVNDDPSVFNTQRPNLSVVDRKVISNLLNRPLPDESEVSRRLAEYRTAYHLSHTQRAETGANFIASSDVISTTLVSPRALLNNPREYPVSAGGRSNNTRLNVHRSPPGVSLVNSQVSAPRQLSLSNVAGTQATSRPLGNTISSISDIQAHGMKRRLGMGRSMGEYTNKKFKIPT